MIGNYDISFAAAMPQGLFAYALLFVTGKLGQDNIG